jgi:hypothetical protein
MDIEQRRQLLKDYTKETLRCQTVGPPRGGRKKKRPSMKTVKKMWEELTSKSTISEPRRNNALFYAARRMGYPAWEIEREVQVETNREEVMRQGKLMMECGYQMSEAWATIEGSINR